MLDNRFRASSRRLLALLALALLQYLAARLDLPHESGLPPLSPAAGVAFGALLRMRPWSWPAVLAGLCAAWLPAAPPVAAVALAGLLTAAPLLAGRYLARQGFDRCLGRPRDAGLLGLAAGASLLLPAMAQAAFLALGNPAPWDVAPGLVARAWLAQVAGVLVIAPLFLLADRGVRRLLRRRRLPEFMGVLLATLLVGWLIFGFRPGLPVTFLALLPFGWAAMRFPGLGTAVAILAFALLGVAGTTAGTGPFATLAPGLGQLLLAAFLSSVSFCTLALAALLSVARRAREDAQASEERLRLALRSGGMGTCDWDLVTGRIEWSEGHARLLGMEPGQFDGRIETFIRRVHPEDLPVMQAVLERSRLERAPYNVEFRVIWPDGTLRWMEGFGSFLRNEADRYTRMVGVMMDVTPRVETVRTIERGSERLRLAMTLAQMGTWELDLRTGALATDEQHDRIFGLEPGSIPTLARVRALIHAADRPRIDAALHEAVSRGVPYRAEFRIMRPRDGLVRWIAAYGEALREHEEPARVIGMVQDVTEQRTAEAELRVNQLRLEGIVNSAMDGIITVDESHRIVVFNRAAERMLGLPRAEALGQEVERFLPLAFPPEEGLGEPQEERFGTLEAVRADGTGFPAEASVTRTRVEDRVLFTVTVRDLTEHQAAEESRRQLERQLRQSQRMEAVGTLAGGIAHDFNNVLGAILGNVELARLDLPGDHPANEALVQITGASLRARDLVRGLLAFTSRHDSPRLPVRLQAVTEEVLRLLRASVPASIEFRTRIDVAAPPVFADPSEIHQVLMNLCTNAFHAMEPAGGVLEVALDRVEVDGDLAGSPPDLMPGPHVRLEVQDSGSGIEPDTLERIFDPFFTTKPPGEGTGLGLAVVHGIVRAHGGAITAESRPGEGSCFRVYLPVAAPEREERPATPSHLPMGAGERVLLVDDEPVLVTIGRRALEWLGYQVTALDDPAEALARFRAAPEAFDLVITDLTMPGVSGTQVAQEVQRIRPGLPVILTSGYGGHAVGGAFGIRELLPKPATLEQLATTVHRVLHDEALAGTSEASRPESSPEPDQGGG